MIEICSLYDDQELSPSDFHLDHQLVNTVVNIYDANPRDMTSDRLYCETDFGSEWLNLPVPCVDEQTFNADDTQKLTRVQADDTLYSSVTVNNCSQENIELSYQVYISRNILTHPPSKDSDIPAHDLVAAGPIDPLEHFTLPLYFTVPDPFINCYYKNLTSALKLHANGISTGLETTCWIPIFNYIQVDRYSVFA